MSIDRTWKSDRSLNVGGGDDEEKKEDGRLAKGLAAHNMRELPDDYVVSDDDVICK